MLLAVSWHFGPEDDEDEDDWLDDDSDDDEDEEIDFSGEED